MTCAITPSQITAAFAALTPTQRAAVCAQLSCPPTPTGVSAAFAGMSVPQINAVLTALGSVPGFSTAVIAALEGFPGYTTGAVLQAGAGGAPVWQTSITHYANDGVTVLFKTVN